MSGPPVPTRTPRARTNPKEAAEQERRYEEYLEAAEKAFDARFRQNSCPSEKIANFHISAYLSKGSFGQVYEVEHLEDKKTYALKVQPKCYRTKEAAAVLREKKLTYALQSEFIIKLHFAFKDSKNLYLVMEHATYGDLSQFMEKRPGEKLTKFFAAQITLAIEYLHRCGIAHRDLKCKNILIASDSYLRIADFGLADKLRVESFRSVGTSFYMAPEMFRNEGYGKGVDWWALGIILFELLFGCHPFAEYDMNKNQVANAVQRVRLTFPEQWPDTKLEFAVYSLIEGLLEKDKSKRLGAMSEGAAAVKNHPWFHDIDFLDIINKVPIKPITNPVDTMAIDEISFLPGSDDSDDMGPDLYEEF